MADHGDNYERMMGSDPNDPDKKVEIGKLGPECGHHCGVITVGQAGNHEAHCSCHECHGNHASKVHINPIHYNEVPAQFTNRPNGVNPRGIR